MVTALAQALMGSVNQTPPVFWALARGFRFMSSEPPRGPREFAEGLHRVVKKSAESSSRTRPRTRAIAKTLEDRMASTGGRLRLHELASELRVNRHYLSRLLKVDTGMTFRQWRWAVLMRAAVGQLGSSDKDIRQIASAAGYEDPRQFDRGFRRLFGTSPREFRRLARNDALLKN
jgi:AraC-like DNA-binding protein